MIIEDGFYSLEPSMRTLELPAPATMQAPDRAAEIATILARCILRHHANRERQFDLGCSPGKRVHTTPSQPPEKHV